MIKYTIIIQAMDYVINDSDFATLGAEFVDTDVVVKCLRIVASKKQTSNGSWRQGIKGEMTCTVYVALVW